MKKITKLTTAAILALAFCSGNVMAKGAPGSGPSPYVDCGIGAALFPDTHWAAISSNVIWDVGTTAVTSATASPETCSGKKVEVAEFINRTYDNLIEDTAKGNGEYLTAMFDIFECSSNARPAMISSFRNAVANGVSQKDYSNKSKLEKSEFLYNQVNMVVNKQDESVCLG